MEARRLVCSLVILVNCDVVDALQGQTDPRSRSSTYPDTMNEACVAERLEGASSCGRDLQGIFSAEIAALRQEQADLREKCLSFDLVLHFHFLCSVQSPISLSHPTISSTTSDLGLLAWIYPQVLSARILFPPAKMPSIRTSRTKPPPEGFEDIEGILEDYARKMRDAENETHEGKRKAESVWPIIRISHQRSRYIYDLYYKREAISRELYDWLMKEKYADAK